MADDLTSDDRAVLLALVTGLEGYLRVDEMDPTGRAHALKALARRAVEQLGTDPAAATALATKLRDDGRADA